MESDHEIYPMPLFPRLVVSDVEISTEWYQTVLGFYVIFSMSAISHVRYRKYTDIMLVAGRRMGDGPVGEGLSIYVTVERESVNDVAERAAEHNAETTHGPEETEWNTREVTFVDPDGYEIVFAERGDTDRSFEEVMDSGHNQ